MFTLRLGAVSNLLSDNLVSGFTCASAFHVVSSQLKDLLGLEIDKRRGNFSFVFVGSFQLMSIVLLFTWIADPGFLKYFLSNTRFATVCYGSNQNSSHLIFIFSI